MTNEEFGVGEAMRRYGGNFVKHLAETYVAADMLNRIKLREAFSAIWETYKGMATIDTSETGDTQHDHGL